MKEQRVPTEGVGETSAGSKSGYWLNNSGFQFRVLAKNSGVLFRVLAKQKWVPIQGIG